MEKFYSAFTVEGFNPKELEKIIGFCVEEDILNSVPNEVFVFTGELMNSTYGLTGNSAYPGDLHFLVIMSEYMGESAAVHPARLEGNLYRWFDDIVANNALNERDLRKR